MNEFSVYLSKLKRDYTRYPLKWGERPHKEDLEYLYLELNLSLEELTKVLNCGKSTRNAQKFLKEFGIKKDKKKVSEVIKKSYLDKYGVTSAFGIKEVQDKIKATNISKYGCENPGSNSLIIEKRNHTIKERYGVDNISSLDSIKEKKKQTTLKSLGVENPNQSEEVKEKVKSTNLSKYGKEYFTQTDIYKERTKNTCISKYGVDNVAKAKEVKDKIKATMYKKYGVSSFTKTKEFLDKTSETCLERYGVPYFCLTKKCRDASGNTVSKINLKWKEFLKADDTEIPVDSLSFDLRCGNVLVEINPTYTHNSTKGTHFKGNYNKPLDKNYHSNKSKVAIEAGYRCVHVFDWDDADKIKDLVLKPNNVLYARKCEIKLVEESIANEFLNHYHIQNCTKSFDVAVGLFHNDELVSLMTFGKPRFNKGVQYELLRYCTKFDTVVVGGSEKIFNYFINEYRPTSIVSYCDLSKFTGSTYKKLGFTLERTSSPTRHWFDGEMHITDNMLRKLGFDNIFGTSFGKGTSNDELMKSAGFLEVYDCGQQTWIWRGR